MSDSEAGKAKRFALRLIRYRDRSEAELTQRLRIKGFSDQLIHDTLQFLNETGLVNDAMLARTLTELAINVRLLGNRGVGFFLRSRGIKENDFPPEDAPDEIERALLLYRKKSKTLSSLPDPEKRRKMRGYLLRKGYSSESVKKVLRTIFNS